MRNERRCPSRGGRHFKNKSTPVIMLGIMIILFVFWGVGCGEENLHNNEISTSNSTTTTTVDEAMNTKTENTEENTIINKKTNTNVKAKTEEKTSKTNKTTTTKRISETGTKATTKKTTTTTRNITKTTITTKNTTKATTKKTTTAEVYSSEGKNLGRFYITVYTPGSDGGGWGYQTSTGVRSKHLQTCAVDPRVIPLGSKIYVNGLTLLACDVGGAIKGSHIDIFYDGSESAAIRWISNFGEHHDVILLN